MNEYFNQDGHITPFALGSLVHETQLDELTRLELAEHLSFCDRCLDAYMVMLDDSLMIDPPQTQAQTIIKRVKQKARILFFNKYTRVAVAACLAITLWTTGVFSTEFAEKNSQLIASVGSSAATLTTRISQWTDDVTDDLQSYFKFDGLRFFDMKGDTLNEKE